MGEASFSETAGARASLSGDSRGMDVRRRSNAAPAGPRIRQSAQCSTARIGVRAASGVSLDGSPIPALCVSDVRPSGRSRTESATPAKAGGVTNGNRSTRFAYPALAEGGGYSPNMVRYGAFSLPGVSGWIRGGWSRHDSWARRSSRMPRQAARRRAADGRGEPARCGGFVGVASSTLQRPRNPDDLCLCCM